MAKPINYIPWENSVKNAVRTFNAETGRGKKQPALKSLPGAPKQPGGHECGYYVMRYMKDIIDDVSLGFPTSGQQRLENHTPKSYLMRCALMWLSTCKICCSVLIWGTCS